MALVYDLRCFIAEWMMGIVPNILPDGPERLLFAKAMSEYCCGVFKWREDE